jgi:hypothetical protein
MRINRARRRVRCTFKGHIMRGEAMSCSSFRPRGHATLWSYLRIWRDLGVTQSTHRRDEEPDHAQEASAPPPIIRSPIHSPCVMSSRLTPPLSGATQCKQSVHDMLEPPPAGEDELPQAATHGCIEACEFERDAIEIFSLTFHIQFD